MTADLSHLLPLLGTPEFLPAAVRALAGLHAAFPLGRGCSGGFPDPASVGVVNPSADADESTVRVRFTATFTERMAPGCAGTADERPRAVELVLTVDRLSGLGRVEAVPEPDPEPEF